MKVNLVKDEAGKVIATFEKESGAAGAFVRPVLKPGHRIEEVEADENYKANIKTFYEQHSRQHPI
jgi:hypothetical protein